MTLPTRPEVRNLLHFGQTKTEPRSHATSAENLVKIRTMSFLRHAHEQTDLAYIYPTLRGKECRYFKKLGRDTSF